MTQYQMCFGSPQMTLRLSLKSLCHVLLAAVCATAASVFAVEAPSKPEVLTLQSFDDEAAIILRPNVDGGNPPAVEASADQPHSGKSCAKLTYKNGASGWGNLQMPLTLCGAEDSIGLWVRKISAAKGAALHIWLFQESGDCWLSPTTKLDELADGWQRVEIKLKDFKFQARANGEPEIAATNRLLIGCNYADFTLCINDLFISGTDIAAKRKAPKSTGHTTVDVDPNAVACQKFLGFGAEWDPKFWTNGTFNLKEDFKGVPAVTEDDWATVIKRIQFMKLPMVRMMICAKWCTEGDGKYNWECNHMKSLYRHLDVCQKEGIAVVLTDWGCVTWTKVPGFSGTADPKYADAIGEYLDHLINKKGYTCIKYFVLVNEPNFEAGGYENWKKGIENVAARKLNEKIVLMGSDQSNADDWHYKAVDQLQNVLGAYDVHRYTNQGDVKSGRFESYVRSMWDYASSKDPQSKDKPMIVAEAGLMENGAGSSQCPDSFKYEYGLNMADYAAQSSNAGSWATLAWMLDDNSHEGFTWGMWKNKAGKLELKPWFYPWSLLCRTVRPCATTYRISGLSKQVRAIAAKLQGDKPETSGWTFVIVNRNSADVIARLHVAQGGKVSMWRYDYSAQAAPVDADGLPRPVGEVQGALDAGIEVTVPGNAAVFLTTVAP